jgi:hypothetical protein
MTYRVANLSTGEIFAELGDFDLAVKLADRYAADDQHRHVWAVIELCTRYETKLNEAEP